MTREGTRATAATASAIGSQRLGARAENSLRIAATHSPMTTAIMATRMGMAPAQCEAPTCVRARNQAEMNAAAAVNEAATTPSGEPR